MKPTTEDHVLAIGVTPAVDWTRGRPEEWSEQGWPGKVAVALFTGDGIKLASGITTVRVCPGWPEPSPAFLTENRLRRSDLDRYMSPSQLRTLFSAVGAGAASRYVGHGVGVTARHIRRVFRAAGHEKAADQMLARPSVEIARMLMAHDPKAQSGLDAMYRRFVDSTPLPRTILERTIASARIYFAMRKLGWGDEPGFLPEETGAMTVERMAAIIDPAVAVVNSPDCTLPERDREFVRRQAFNLGRFGAKHFISEASKAKLLEISGQQ